ncbi:MAG: hypothetical protein ACRDZR_14455, partial [Acidimicrobiales bacterium]
MQARSEAVGEAAAGEVPEPRVPHRRRWRSIVFAPSGDGGARRRRGSDGIRVAAAVLVVACCWLITTVPAHAEVAVVRFLTPPPHGVAWLVNLVWWLGSAGVIVVLGVLALLSHRREVARDVLLSGLVAWVLSLLAQGVIGAGGGHAPTPALHGVNLGFPVARVAGTMAVTSASLPYLSRGLQRALEVVVALAALSTVVHGSGLPISVLASLAIGWGVAAAVHLAFGSPLGLPSVADVTALLTDLGIRARRLAAARDQVWGVARYRGEDAEGPVAVSVYGRDAHDAQLLAKTFRFLAYRDSGPTLTLTRVQQVEHEAYLSLLADRAGARGPGVLAAGTTGPSRDAVLVTRPPPGPVLAELFDEPGSVPADRFPDAAADDLFAQILALRSARIAHGSVSPSTVTVGTGGTAGLVDFRSATAAGREERLDRDVAAALATV